MNSVWIEGRFEGVYSGQRRERSGAGGRRILGGARQFSFELQSGNVRDVQPIAAPTDPDRNLEAKGGANAATDAIRLKRIEHVSMPRPTPRGLPRDDGTAPEASRETSLFDVRIHDWHLTHPAEVAGRSFGTLYGTIQARLTPEVDERPLELISVTPAAARSSRVDEHTVAKSDTGGSSKNPEDAAAPPQAGELLPSATDPESDGLAMTITDLWWTLRILALVLIAAGLAYACSPRNAEQPRRKTPSVAQPSGPRTDADGRWPVAPSASSSSAAPSRAEPLISPSAASTPSAGPSGPQTATAAGPAGSRDGSPSDPRPNIGDGSATPLAAAGNGAPEPLQLRAANDSEPPRDDRAARRGADPTATAGVQGGWVTPDHREATRTAMMISIEHANRAPDEFYASKGERRVYLPTDSIFVHGGSSLRPGGDLDLMRVSALLSLPGKPRVEIEVHTDAGGSRAKQLELSRRRAAKLHSWLLDRGHIDAQRFDVRGVGSSRPVVPPDGSYTAQSPNRRLEIRVVE